MLFAGLSFRNSEYAVKKWYEGRSADGQTYDMRPFFPAKDHIYSLHI